MVPAWIWTGAVRLHAANGLFIEGKGWSKSVTFLLRNFRGLLFIQARSQDIRQMYLRRMCRSMKRPACAPFDSSRNPKPSGGFHSHETPGRSKTSMARRTGAKGRRRNGNYGEDPE